MCGDDTQCDQAMLVEVEGCDDLEPHFAVQRVRTLPGQG
jgi:hypothetical protein